MGEEVITGSALYVAMQAANLARRDLVRKRMYDHLREDKFHEEAVDVAHRLMEDASAIAKLGYRSVSVSLTSWLHYDEETQETLLIDCHEMLSAHDFVVRDYWETPPSNAAESVVHWLEISW